jgi:hypothetical protein
MKIYIANNVSDMAKENRHWAFDSQKKANDFVAFLIEGLKERNEIDVINHESDNELHCETSYGQYVRIYVEELELN